MPRAAFDPSPASFAKPAPSAPSLLKQDANRAPRFWHAAVSATKGLFNQPVRAALNDDVTAGIHVPLVEQRQKRVRKSISTPALKASASTPNLRRDVSNALSPPVPSLFAKRSFEQSPRKLRSKAAAGSSAARRPVISSPSLPKSLDRLDSSAHSKLAYPLSPMPSPVGSTFSLKPPAPQATSSLMNDGASPDDSASADTDACSASRSVRRRTKSAPGPKFGKQALFSPAMSVAQDSETSSLEPFSPIVIDIASPSIASPNSCSSFPSPPLYTPAMPSGCFSDSSSPLVQMASPRSFMSVKRKPVPRHLYMDPPEHDASAPCTPVFTPIPNSSPGANTSSGASRGEGSATLHTPLLPSSELILKACNPSRSNSKGLNLLPIGLTSSAGSARRNHRRSVSEHGCRRLFNQDAAVGLPSPWYTTNASGSMTQLITPAEEHAPFSFANDLPAAPRPVQTPPQTPTPIAEEISAFSDNTSVRSSVCRTGALSPLTDDEIDALRNFLRRHATGHRERQRRKATKFRETRSRSTSVVSYSYDMHTQIYDCYANEDDEFLSGDASEDDADAESHLPMSASETHSMSTASVIGTQENGEDEPDYNASASVNGDAVEAPIDSVNRGTFGYYGTPVARRPISRLEPSYEYIPKDSEGDVRPSLPGEWKTFSESPRAEKTGCTADEFSRSRSDNVNCGGREDSTEPVIGHTRSSSVYYPFSSDPSPRGHFDYLRISRQPLVPRMSSSDSESDRPSSSSASSLSPSTSTGRSAFASGIGLAIIPPEHFAHFDRFERYEYVPPCSPSELDAADDSEGSPTMLGCASPSDSLRSCGHRRFASTFPDLSRFQAVEDMQRQYGVSGATPALKPALQINASFSASSMGQLPSPTDTIESCPPKTFTTAKSSGKLATPEVGRYRGAASADEAMADAAKSFMNLTPNEPAPKRSRVKLRQLFSRSNLKSAATRKAST